MDTFDDFKLNKILHALEVWPPLWKANGTFRSHQLQQFHLKFYFWNLFSHSYFRNSSPVATQKVYMSLHYTWH